MKKELLELYGNDYVLKSSKVAVNKPENGETQVLHTRKVEEIYVYMRTYDRDGFVNGVQKIHLSTTEIKGLYKRITEIETAEPYFDDFDNESQDLPF